MTANFGNPFDNAMLALRLDRSLRQAEAGGKVNG
jgi:hypothetical protein